VDAPVSTFAVERWFPWFKAAIFALLAANAAGFALFGRPTEAVDSFAWLVLLALFELETAYPQRVREARVSALVRAARFVAGVAVVIAALGFVREREWLDAINAALWIAVVVVLEIEVRFPKGVERRRRLFATVAGVLYAGMALLVLTWAWQGEWFDAYDAALWLIAFVALEMNVLQISRAPATR
jgi:hypothetical protein